MKILVLADEPDKMLWDYLDRRRLEDIRLVLSCGDLPAEYLSFLTCFTHAPILYVRGNHDARYAQNPPEGCVCIENMVYEHEGIRILGLGGSIRYSGGTNQYTEREMRSRIKKWRLRREMHKGVDIVLTHSPVRSLGDGDDRAHRGFETFRYIIKKYSPRYLVHGHMHKSYTSNFIRERRLDNTVVVNAWQSYVIEI